MSSIINNSKPPGVGKREWLNRRFIPLLTLLLVVVITIVVFLNRDRVAELGNYGYLGAFLVSLVFNATIVLPMPGFLLLFALGAVFNPVLVGLAGATGGTIGELTGYMAGYNGRGVIRSNKMYARTERWMRRWGAITIFIFALVPLLPFDLAGIIAGVLRFPVWKFLLICWVAKVLLYVALATAGAWGWEAILRYLG
ncbi:YqaA family protein [Chloroflexota bacterium]